MIDRGAHGVVFQAADRHGIKVAIKWLTKRRDERELVTVVRLSKVVKGMPSILSSGVLEDRTYFVMPYYERRSLGFRLRSLTFPQPVSEVIRLANAFTDVLGELHRHGFTYFDFKPDNLLIEALPSATEDAPGSLLRLDERLVLTDFGTARTVNDEDRFGDGTMGYAAPELFTKLIDHDPRVDVYAASAALVECMTSIAPKQVRSTTEAAFEDHIFQLTGPFESILRRGLNFDPNHRPPTVSDWFNALRQQAEAVETFQARQQASAAKRNSATKQKSEAHQTSEMMIHRVAPTQPVKIGGYEQLGRPEPVSGDPRPDKASKKSDKSATERAIRHVVTCLLYTSPSPRDATLSRMPSAA